MTTPRKTYTGKFKLDTLRLVETSDKPIAVIERELGLSQGQIHHWRRELARLRLIHAQNRQTYGSPRIHAELRAQGVACSRHRVARLMRRHAIRPRHKRRFRHTTRVNPRLPVAANRLNQTFVAERPNQVWLSDLTYVPTTEGWLYLAVVLDLHSRRVVGWQTSAQLDTSLALGAWQMAVGRRAPLAGGLHHSDRGSQYASALYQQHLTARAWMASMSGKGNCYDNAPMESFFATLKTELIHRVEVSSTLSMGWRIC